MSGNIASLASFNGTGTQGTAVVDKVEKEGDIMSVIWNKNDTTRQLITGTALKELTPQGIVNDRLNNSTTIFTINNDVDVIGEFYLSLIITQTTTAIASLIPTQIGTANIINKIEVLIGSQVWQTLTPGTLAASAALLQPHLVTAFENPRRVTSHSYDINLPLTGMFVNTTMPLDSNFSDQRNNGYLMAAAPNQEMHIKIYWASGKNINWQQLNPPSELNYDFTRCRLLFKHTSLSNFERSHIQNMVIPKRVTFTQGVSQSVTLAQNETNRQIRVNCDKFNILAYALAIGFRNNPILGEEQFSSDEPPTVELFLNGSSFSGRVSLSLLNTLGGHMINSNSTPDTHCIFPLANCIYGSGVPLNRFDTITIVIDIPIAKYTLTERDDVLDIVALGSSTILYSGGAASINRF